MAASPPKSLRLRINIGGQKIIEVQPELFRVAGDNKLSALFSGRWEPHLDASGNYFVDYSPEVFMPFGEWLREFRDSAGSKASMRRRRQQASPCNCPDDDCICH